jgi:hypothetical protein
MRRLALVLAVTAFMFIADAGWPALGKMRFTPPMLSVAHATPDPQPGFNSWHQTCAYDYTRMRVGNDDPIVAFGGVSHHAHVAFCNIGMTPTSKAWATLPVSTRNDPGYVGATGGNGSTGDTYGYWPLGWMPVSYLDGVENPNHRDPCFLNSDGTTNCPRTIKSAYAKFSYRSVVGEQVNTIPYGALMIVGNAHAASEAEQDTAHVYWTCGDIDGGTSRPHNCAGQQQQKVTTVYVFPDCWAGNSAAHPAWLNDGWNGLFSLQQAPVQSIGAFDHPAGIALTNFAYSVAGVCPGMFPVKIAQLVARIHYSSNDAANTPLVNPLDANGNVRISFASGPWYTAHFDWMETANMATEIKTLRCNNGIIDSRTYRTDCSSAVGA